MAWAQGPNVDPGFQPTSVYKPAVVRQAIEQADGKRVLLGDMTRASGSPAKGLARLLAASNQSDAVFQTNVQALQGTVQYVVLLPNGQLLLTSSGALSLGSVTRQRLLRLNTDGTPDAGFDAGTGSWQAGGLNHVLAQPDGKLLVVGTFNVQLNGITVRNLLRLDVDGTLDTSFQTALGTGLNAAVNFVALQPDGKILVAGNFSQVDGLPRQGVARLLASGAPDASFTSPIPSNTTARALAVQPDGKVLVGGDANSAGGWLPLMRLLPSGVVDTGFQASAAFNFSSNSAFAPALLVQPDGNILVYTKASAYTGPSVGELVRLLPDGSLDPSFSNTARADASAFISSVQLLANGQLLVSATQSRYASTGGLRTGVALLQANGAIDSGFAPSLLTPAQVYDVVRLANGSYLAGGDFTEIDGQPIAYLAYLSANGVPDAALSAPMAPDNAVNSLLVQADGKVLVGGFFGRIAGSSRASVARLLPSGTLDTGFTSPFTTSPDAWTTVRHIARHPDGRVLVAGSLRLANGSTSVDVNGLYFLDGATGQLDVSMPHYVTGDMLVQPGGKIVIAGEATPAPGTNTYSVFRILADGSFDSPFPGIINNFTGSVPTVLAQDATGRLYVGGRSGISPTSTSFLQLLSVDGQPTAGGTGYLSAFSKINSVAVQPNGLILLGGLGSSSSLGLDRITSPGLADPTFTASNGPASAVNRLLVQADGAIMAAGSFTTVGGQAIGGLVRLLDANVLSISNQPLAARTQAWPVPAHNQLHLALDAARRPQRVELLDALGRVALAQAVSQAELTLDTSPLRAGHYVLRVQYANGPVTRRVVVE
ncbi:T9SS type A sorting domain-containing protein [Siccationidurans soli]|uniref:T9SS type A sorting domain-containing protein n=2 Tax=Hymenobacter negativus TaxID=2795026 RepID=A0ABS3QGV2_9BACT|nr:T9SS type A sorting domain-containing protein [Hymenobacter negativus]